MKSGISLYVHSGKRDKTKYPLQSDFVINPAHSAQSSSVKSPVGLGMPLFINRVYDHELYFYRLPYFRMYSIPYRFFREPLFGFGNRLDIVSSSTHETLITTKVINYGEYFHWPVIPTHFQNIVTEKIEGVSGSFIDDYIVVRQHDSDPYLRFSTNSMHPKGSTSITIPSGSANDGEYDNMYLMFFYTGDTNPGEDDVPYYDIGTYSLYVYRVKSYNGATKVATLDKPLEQDYDGSHPIEIYKPVDAESGLWPVNSSAQRQLYKVTLDFIRIPMKSSLGMYWRSQEDPIDIWYDVHEYSNVISVSNFSHLVVELYNENAPSTDGIVSNNPHVRRSTFVVDTAEQYSHQLDRAFNTIYSSQERYVFLNLNEPIRFRVRLPGDREMVFEKLDEQTNNGLVSPDFSQISALFRLEPVNI